MNKISINGRICYEAKCPSCSKDKGFVRKENLNKDCKSCSNIKNKTGKPSPKKGIKTFKPAHNRGEFFNEPLKKKLKNRMSRRMRHALSNKNLSKEWIHIFKLVGFSVEELKVHLESKFQVGMTWENIGDWHIDHVFPESKFNYKSFEDLEFKQCWSLSNLQPLWAEDNLKKGNKILTGGGLFRKL